MFLANLNVFVAASLILSVLGGALIGTFLMVPIALLAKALSIDVWKSSWLVGYLVIPLVLGIVWARRGLAPPERLPGREQRYRRGQRLLFAANVLLLVTFLLPMVFAAIGGKPEYQLYGFYLMPLMVLALIGGPFGLYMVLSSRA